MSATSIRPLDLKLEPIAIPLSKRHHLLRRYVFRRGGKEAFIVGEDFEVTYTITNIDDIQFPGGVLEILIKWPNGQGEQSPYQIPVLAPGASKQIPAPWGVLAMGFALFKVVMHQGGVLKMTQSGYTIQNIHAFSNLYRDEQRQNRILQDVSFFSVFGQNAEEFYEYWGMMTAALSLLIIVLVEVVPIIIGFVRFLITLIL